MKRMIPTKLIDWVKKLFGAVQPGAKEGDVEIGGNLEVEGSLSLYGGNYKFSDIDGNLAEYCEYGYGQQYGLVFGADNPIAALGCFEGISSNLDPSTGVQIVDDGIVYLRANNNDVAGALPGQFQIFEGNTFKIGNTELTEAQLKKLIALIPAE